jgi:hypothetical protein
MKNEKQEFAILDAQIDRERAAVLAVMLYPQLATRFTEEVYLWRDPEMQQFVFSVLDLLPKYPGNPRGVLARVPIRPSGNVPRILERLAHAQAFSDPGSYMSEEEATQTVSAVLENNHAV